MSHERAQKAQRHRASFFLSSLRSFAAILSWENKVNQEGAGIGILCYRSVLHASSGPPLCSKIEGEMKSLAVLCGESQNIAIGMQVLQHTSTGFKTI